ncbi:hypothetical protein SCHPADRAFT_938420 [Schizopora paradoxa]|uniref:Uncharacterized protein n=1 Tax=Schizopora paradoxa TaxID=27342 RepID=A0A0H2RUY1_9AGAM|nr:hypothetical protein SCHPADRAFT_938420 [Schizopora paradoxa]
MKIEDLIPLRHQYLETKIDISNLRTLQAGSEITFYIKPRGEDSNMKYDVFFLLDEDLTRCTILSEEQSEKTIQIKIADVGVDGGRPKKLKKVEEILRPQKELSGLMKLVLAAMFLFIKEKTIEEALE